MMSNFPGNINPRNQPGIVFETGQDKSNGLTIVETKRSMTIDTRTPEEIAAAQADHANLLKSQQVSSARKRLNALTKRRR